MLLFFSNSRQCYITLCCTDCSIYAFITAVSFCAQVNWKSHEIHIFAILTVGKGLFSIVHGDCTLVLRNYRIYLKGMTQKGKNKTAVKTGKIMWTPQLSKHEWFISKDIWRIFDSKGLEDFSSHRGVRIENAFSYFLSYWHHNSKTKTRLNNITTNCSSTLL